MADVFSSEENIGYGSRVKSSFGAALVGLVMFAAAFPLHFWNEGRAVAEHRALQEGAAAVVEAPTAPLDPALEGKLVHASARATAPQPVADAQFGLSAQALALQRQVEMFQWREHKKTRTEKKLGGGERKITEYRYDTGWDDEAIDSARFEHRDGHENPHSWPFSSARFEANPVRLGDLVLSSPFVGRIGGAEPLVPTLSALPPNLGASFQIDDGRLVTSKDPGKPQVGDLRVAWQRVPEQDVSVVGLQHNGGIEPYTASNGRQIALLDAGAVPAAKMFQAAEARNTRLTWPLRAAGAFLMWLGLTMALGWIGRVLDFIPFLGSLVETGVSIVAALVALVLSALTIAVAWFYYRPVVAVALIALALGGVLLLRRRARRPPPPPAAGLPPMAPPPPPPAAA